MQAFVASTHSTLFDQKRNGALKVRRAGKMTFSYYLSLEYQFAQGKCDTFQKTF
jgi:hypothetical protein